MKQRLDIPERGSIDLENRLEETRQAAAVTNNATAISMERQLDGEISRQPATVSKFHLLPLSSAEFQRPPRLERRST